jgi:hypothetical protein
LDSEKELSQTTNGMEFTAGAPDRLDNDAGKRKKVRSIATD